MSREFEVCGLNLNLIFNKRNMKLLRGNSVKSLTDRGFTKGLNITTYFCSFFRQSSFLRLWRLLPNGTTVPISTGPRPIFRISSGIIQCWRLWTLHVSGAASTTWLRVSARRPSRNRLYLGFLALSEGWAGEARGWLVVRFSAPMPMMRRHGWLKLRLRWRRRMLRWNLRLLSFRRILDRRIIWRLVLIFDFVFEVWMKKTREKERRAFHCIGFSV